MIGEKEYGNAVGSTKQEAKQLAAKLAYEQIQLEKTLMVRTVFGFIFCILKFSQVDLKFDCIYDPKTANHIAKGVLDSVSHQWAMH